MKEAKIIDVGRGPQIEGSRITVFDILEYHKIGWHRDEIAVLFDLSSQQVEAAIRYIKEHRDEVMASYAMNMDSNTITSGNNPRIAGTRISVYAILEYLQKGWCRDEIATLFRLGSRQLDAAIRYIEEHRDEVMVEYNKIIARIARGNSPALQAKLDAVQGSARARLEEIRRSKSRETADERHPRGQ